MHLNENLGNLSDEQIVKRSGVKGEVIALLRHEDGTCDIHKGDNLVVTTGTNYYAEILDIFYNTGTTTNDFDSCYLGNPAGDDTILAGDNFSNWGQGTIGSSTEKAIESGYPKINDTDTDNTGKGTHVLTWKFTWGGGDFDTESANDVRTGIISIASATGTNPLLNHWNFTSPFEKLSTSSLTLWVNHTLAGV